MHLPLTKQLNWKNGIKGQRFEGIMRRTDVTRWQVQIFLKGDCTIPTISLFLNFAVKKTAHNSPLFYLWSKFQSLKAPLTPPPPWNFNRMDVFIILGYYSYQKNLLNLNPLFSKYSQHTVRFKTKCNIRNKFKLEDRTTNYYWLIKLKLVIFQYVV